MSGCVGWDVLLVGVQHFHQVGHQAPAHTEKIGMQKRCIRMNPRVKSQNQIIEDQAHGEAHMTTVQCMACTSVPRNMELPLVAVLQHEHTNAGA